MATTGEPIGQGSLNLGGSPMSIGRVKDSIVSLLIDPPTFTGRTETEWRPPEISPSLDEAREAQSTLETMLLPSTDQEIITCLKAMITIMPSGSQNRSTSDTSFKEMCSLYIGSLEDIPTDLLEMACRECMKTEKWFPTPATIREKIANDFHHRQRMKTRCDLLLKHIRSRVIGADKQKPYPDVSGETVEDRIRNMRASFAKMLDKPGLSYEFQKRFTDRYNDVERELAAIEGRDPIERPEPPKPASKPSSIGNSLGPMTRVSDAMADLTDRKQAEFFRSRGEEGMARASERAIADRAKRNADRPAIDW